MRELGFEDGVDTLGRWMAHHLAESIDKAENGATAAERLKAGKTATETILKVWKHRTTLPGKAYPLAPYDDVLKVINLLKPDNNPFSHFRYSADAKREQLAADIFDGLSRLIIALLFMKVPSEVLSAEVDAAAIEALSETEQHIWRALQQWAELFMTGKTAGKARKSKKNVDSARVNFDEVAVRIIDSLTTTLAKLRSELQKSAADTVQLN